MLPAMRMNATTDDMHTATIAQNRPAYALG